MSRGLNAHPHARTTDCNVSGKYAGSFASLPDKAAAPTLLSTTTHSCPIASPVVLAQPEARYRKMSFCRALLLKEPNTTTRLSRPPAGSAVRGRKDTLDVHCGPTFARDSRNDEHRKHTGLAP